MRRRSCRRIRAIRRASAYRDRRDVPHRGHTLATPRPTPHRRRHGATGHLAVVYAQTVGPSGKTRAIRVAPRVAPASVGGMPKPRSARATPPAGTHQKRLQAPATAHSRERQACCTLVPDLALSTRPVRPSPWCINALAILVRSPSLFFFWHTISRTRIARPTPTVSPSMVPVILAGARATAAVPT